MTQSLKEVREQILDSVIERHFDHRLTWLPREGEQSFETTIGSFNYHIDRRSLATGISYKFWVFDDKGNDLDSFLVDSLIGIKPKITRFDSYGKAIGAIYREIKDKQTIDLILPALAQLKAR